MVSDSHALFSFLAHQIADFVQEHHSDCFSEDPQHHLQLGFTFSFPVDQKAINKGYLIRWTKGFDIPDAIGKDVCALLQAEIDALNLPVKVAAIVNDTVGTLMARSYTSPGRTGTLLGAIFGTGTNGAYVEKLQSICKMSKSTNDGFAPATEEMVINTEWGSFDNDLRVLPSTPYDRVLDSNSVNPGIQMFEKRVSGMFLGEILRNAMLKLVASAGLFYGLDIPPKSPLFAPWGIDTSLLSFVEADDTGDLARAKQCLSETLLIESCSTMDAQSVKTLAHAIGRRSARLSAVPIAAILLATGKLPSRDTSASNMNATRAPNPSLLQRAIRFLKAAIFGIRPISDTPPSPTTPLLASQQQEKWEEEVVDIGVDGSVVEFYPHFEEYLREALRDVSEIGEEGEKSVRMGVAKDGSGVGAALIALIAEADVRGKAGKVANGTGRANGNGVGHGSG
jgi:hexokinase